MLGTRPRLSQVSRRNSALVCAFLCILPRLGQAQDISKHYYHVEQVTTGCQNPAAVRLLTDPNETNTADARRLRSIRGSGHCVTITPRSQWSYLWRENDVAMMSYSGSVGRPGSYYLKVQELVDANGQHPGGVDVDPYPTASASDAGGNTVASTPLAPPAAKAAEVPIITPSSAPPQIASANLPGKSIDDLIDKAGNTPLSFAPPREATASRAELSSSILVPMACLALFIGAIGLYTALRGRTGKASAYEPALEIALGEVRAQGAALREAKADVSHPDRYGTLYSDGWEREKAAFVGARIAPRLRAAGCDGMLPKLLPAIDTEIERYANASVEPSHFDTGADPGHVAEISSADADLCDYAGRCTIMLQKAGWTTNPSPAVCNRAVDIFAERDGRRLLLQCKGADGPVGVEAVQQVSTLKDRRHADVAAIVTLASFTRAAQQMASAAGVHALRDEDLAQIIR
jgi:restriction system protein